MLSDYNETISVQTLPLCVCVCVCGGGEKKNSQGRGILVHYWTGLLSEDHIHLSVTKQSARYIYVCTAKPYDNLKVTNALAMPLGTPSASY